MSNKRFKFNFSEPSPDDFLTKPFALVKYGGAIGETTKYPLMTADGLGSIVETGDHQEIKDKVRSYNRGLTPGEKKYYGLRYKTVKLTPQLVRRVEKTRALYQTQIEEVNENGFGGPSPEDGDDGTGRAQDEANKKSFSEVGERFKFTFSRLFDDHCSVIVHKLSKSGKWAIGKQISSMEDSDKYMRPYFSPAKSSSNYSEAILIKGLGGSRGVSVQSEVDNYLEMIKEGNFDSDYLERIK